MTWRVIWTRTWEGGSKAFAARIRPRLKQEFHRSRIAADADLLDEPFLGVAPILVDEVMAVLRRLSGESVTFLLVEQNIHRALDFVQHA